MIDRDTVIQWAISVGYPGVNEYGAAPDFVAALPSLMAVAQKAVEGEREACAALCEVVGQRPEWFEAEDCAIAIRNRGIGGGE